TEPFFADLPVQFTVPMETCALRTAIRTVQEDRAAVHDERGFDRAISDDRFRLAAFELFRQEQRSTVHNHMAGIAPFSAETNGVDMQFTGRRGNCRCPAVLDKCAVVHPWQSPTPTGWVSKVAGIWDPGYVRGAHFGELRQP